MNRPRWRWWAWCAVNWLLVEWRWLPLWWLWSALIHRDWLGDGGVDCGEGEPF